MSGRFATDGRFRVVPSGQAGAASERAADFPAHRRAHPRPGGMARETLAPMRALILEADAEMAEEWKWAKASSPGTPVWSHHGVICTGEAYTNVVKLTFARGASIPDPSRLFNASLEGNTRRRSTST